MCGISGQNLGKGLLELREKTKIYFAILFWVYSKWRVSLFWEITWRDPLITEMGSKYLPFVFKDWKKNKNVGVLDISLNHCYIWTLVYSWIIITQWDSLASVMRKVSWVYLILECMMVQQRRLTLWEVSVGLFKIVRRRPRGFALGPRTQSLHLLLEQIVRRNGTGLGTPQSILYCLYLTHDCSAE